VYLIVAWLLHFLIWSSIIMRFFEQHHGEKCGTHPNYKIPEVVTFILFSQFLAFTFFSVFNSVQFCFARPLDRASQFRNWNWYSITYGVLSVTAKVLLEVGFLWYVANARTWPLASVSTVVRGNMVSGHQCWAVQN